MNWISFIRNRSLMVKIPVTVVGVVFLMAGTLLGPIILQISVTEIRNLEIRLRGFLGVGADEMVPYILRKDFWAAYEHLHRLQRSQPDLDVEFTLVLDSTGRVFTSSRPGQHRINDQVHLKDGIHDVLTGDLDIPSTFLKDHIYFKRHIKSGERTLGTIIAAIRLQGLWSRIRDIVLLSLVFTAVVTLLCGGIGYLVSREMILPLSRLKDHVDKVSHGNIQLISQEHILANDELYRLMDHFNHMASALLHSKAVTKKLEITNQLTALGRLSLTIAHEINNPLGGMLNVVDTLKQHGSEPSVRDRSLSLLERGMQQIQSIVGAALVTYRLDRDYDRLLPVDLEDIRLLIQNRAKSSQILLKWDNHLPGEIDLPAVDVRQLLLNLLLNACEAMGQGGELSFSANTTPGFVSFGVEDTGPGLREDLIHQLVDGQYSLNENERGGLGLWVCQQVVNKLDGNWEINSTLGQGTRFDVIFPLEAWKPDAALDQ